MITRPTSFWLLGLSLFLAVALVVATFFISASADSPFLLKAALSPGLALWHLSNLICPPFGERCFLFSERQIAHHLWGLICYVTAWWAIIFAVLLGVRALTLRSKGTAQKRAAS
ncbi:MAG: hypothetical protein ACXWF8_11705 [Methylobacter sp.]